MGNVSVLMEARTMGNVSCLMCYRTMGNENDCIYVSISAPWEMDLVLCLWGQWKMDLISCLPGLWKMDGSGFMHARNGKCIWACRDAKTMGKNSWEWTRPKTENPLDGNNMNYGHWSMWPFSSVIGWFLPSLLALRFLPGKLYIRGASLSSRQYPSI